MLFPDCLQARAAVWGCAERVAACRWMCSPAWRQAFFAAPPAFSLPEDEFEGCVRCTAAKVT